MGGMNPVLDVLVCAFNEAGSIPRLLKSLRSQSTGLGAFRVIVVDNASTDRTGQAVEEHGIGLNLAYVYEPRLGLNHARNAGYRHARAPYVAHIDADAQADIRWIETIIRVIRTVEPDLCGGPYFPYYLGPKPAWFLNRYNSNYKGPAPRYLGDDEHLSGTNMIWRRALVERVGGFRLDVGLTGRNLPRGDETNLILRAHEQIPDFKAYYHPGIVVHHLTRPETTSLWYWLRRSFAAGRQHNKVFNIPSHDRARVYLLGRLLKTAALVGGRSAKMCLVRDRTVFPYWQNYVYECSLLDIYRLGRLWEAVTGWSQPTGTQVKDGFRAKYARVGL